MSFIRQSTAVSLVIIASTLLVSRGNADSTNSSLRLEVPEEARLEQSATTVTLTIRLGRGVTAHLWAATECQMPSANSITIVRSGRYEFAIDQLGLRESGHYCLLSSDQRIRLMI